MNRYFRGYEIQILTPNQELITIKPPISVNFNITRNTLASANKCQLNIYNLGSSTRTKLYKDRFTFNQYWQIIIKAGFTEGKVHLVDFNLNNPWELPTVFRGNIYECSSYKQGNNWITNFDCFDGGYAIQNGFTNMTMAKNTNFTTMITSMIKNAPNTILGTIGSFTGTQNKRGKVLFGPTYDAMQQESDGYAFIDNERVNVLMDDEVIGAEVILLDSSIMKTTPKRRDVYLDCDLLFFPEAQIKKICQIYSQNEAEIDPYKKLYFGQYAIHGFTHNVNIMSDSCGDATTKINLYKGAGGLRSA